MGQHGAFEPILREGQYQKLLSGVQVDVLLEINCANRNTPDIPEAVSRMLGERNWRTDLVAAAAAVISERPTAHVPALWEAFDYGSWVAPQLAVCLRSIDPQFRHAAKDRIVARGAPSAGAVVRPTPRDLIVAKNLVSLLQALRQLDSERAWVDAERRSSDVAMILSQDIDNAGEIANSWGDSMSRALNDLRERLSQNAG